MSTSSKKCLSPIAVAVTIVAAVIAIPLVNAQEPKLNAGERVTPGRVDAREERRSGVKLVFSQYFRPYYYAHLIHARNFCKLSREQLSRIRPETDQAFEAFVSRLATDPPPPRPVATKGRQAVTESSDPLAELQTSIVSIIQKSISTELRGGYEAEIARRNGARKAAGVRMLMAILDEEFVLSTDQHDRLSEVLSSHWKSYWPSIIDLNFGEAGVFLPFIPDAVVEPILDPWQSEVWRSKTKYTGALLGNPMIVRQLPRLEEELGAGDSKAPSAPAAEPVAGKHEARPPGGFGR